MRKFLRALFPAIILAFLTAQGVNNPGDQSSGNVASQGVNNTGSGINPATLWMLNGVQQARFQTNSASFNTPSDSSHLSVISQIMIPVANWACQNPRFIFTGYAARDTHVEAALSETLTIAALQVGPFGGPYTTVTFGGNASGTYAAGSQLISDAAAGVTIPANSSNYVYQVVMTATDTSATFPGYYETANGVFGGTKHEGTTSGTQAAMLALLGTNVSTASATAFGATAIVCQGWDGSPVAVMGGDSIGYGQNESSDGNARGVFGFINHGMDDSASSVSMPIFNMGTQGESWIAATSEGAATLGHYGYHIQMLNALAALNPGNHLPFTTFISQHWHNDPNVADGQAWWGMIHTAFPGITLVQTTGLPSATNSDSTGVCASGSAIACYTDQTGSDQLPFSAAWDWPNGGTWANFNAGLTGGTFNCPNNTNPGECVDGVIDVNSTTPSVMLLGLWNPGPYTATFASTATEPTKTLVLTGGSPGVCPLQYANLVLEPNTTNMEQVGTAQTVVPNSPSAGECTVTTFANTGITHSSGASVAEGYPADGTHQTTDSALLIANAIIAAKNNHIIK